jgi:ABC-2 type transport system permease protein
LAFASPWAGFCALLFGAGAIASSALVNLWRQAPSRRGLVLRRHSQSKLVGMMEHLVSILWAVATTAAVVGSWTTVVPLAAVAAVLALNWKWAAMATPAQRLTRS